MGELLSSLDLYVKYILVIMDNTILATCKLFEGVLMNGHELNTITIGNRMVTKFVINIGLKTNE